MRAGTGRPGLLDVRVDRAGRVCPRWRFTQRHSRMLLPHPYNGISDRQHLVALEGAGLSTS